MSEMFIDEGAPAVGRQKPMLATTVYDRPASAYVSSLASTRVALAAADIPHAYCLLSGNCHVDDARNVVVQQFLLSDCTDLVFLDADVSWKPAALVALLEFRGDAIVGGVYPFRRTDSQLARGLPVRMLPGVIEPDANGLLEVAGLPTGFMRIPRCVIEALCGDAVHFRNRNETRSLTPILFARTTGELRWDGDEGVYVCNRYGGDIAFCALWRKRGGQVFAAVDFELAHTGSDTAKDSLAAALRRQTGETMRHVADAIRDGAESLDVFNEAVRYADNPFAPPASALLTAAAAARKADGPILDVGSGLSTVVMAAAAPARRVWCLEHDMEYAARTESLARQANTLNVSIVQCGLSDDWYAIEDALPQRFAIAFVDGPPRLLGDRMRFFEEMAGQCDAIIVDDADDPAYRNQVCSWAQKSGRQVTDVDGRVLFVEAPESSIKAA